MSLANTISSNLKELLPPCLEPMMKQIVKDIDLYWPMQRSSLWKGYKPLGASFGYSMEILIEKSMEVVTSTGKKITEKAARTLFSNDDLRPGIEGLHYFWQENGLSCESLTVSGAQEILTDCYEGPFKGRLLSHVCIDKPTFLNELLFPYDKSPNLLSAPFEKINGWSYVNKAGIGIGVVAGIKVIQNLWNGNRSRALMWTVVGAASLLAFKL